MPADSSTTPTVSTIEGEEQGVSPGEDWEDDLGPDPVSAVPAADPSPVPEAPVHPPRLPGVRLFMKVPSTLGSPAPPARISGHCPTTFLNPHRGASRTACPFARGLGGTPCWWGESEPGVLPTVVAGMDGGLGPVHGGGEEGGAAHLDQTRDEEGIRGGLPTPLVPQGVTKTPHSDQPAVELSFPEGLSHPFVPPGYACMVRGRLPTGVQFHYVLNSRVIADVVLASDSTATAVQLADLLMHNFDCRRYTHEEILDRLGLYLCRTYESAVRRRCEEGLVQGLSPDELCRSVYRAFDRAE